MPILLKIAKSCLREAKKEEYQAEAANFAGKVITSQRLHPHMHFLMLLLVI